MTWRVEESADVLAPPELVYSAFRAWLTQDVRLPAVLDPLCGFIGVAVVTLIKPYASLRVFSGVVNTGALECAPMAFSTASAAMR